MSDNDCRQYFESEAPTDLVAACCEPAESHSRIGAPLVSEVPVTGMPRLALLILMVLVPSLAAAPPVQRPLPAAARRRVDFQRDIKPIFTRHCFSCHGPRRQESDYRLDRARTAISGGDRKQNPIRPGKSAESPLIRFVAGLDPDTKMPPKGPRLQAGEIAILRAWIDQGARYPVTTDPDNSAATRHWSFQPLAYLKPPRSQVAKNPIDTFLHRRLRQAGLTFSARADRRTLVRRLYLNLLGLPPSPDEIASFLTDDHPGAWPRLVDRVLASPHYGERWARHWLDVVRFAESHGYETNRERPTAWYYRDWCIEALNADLPYDQFLFAQLAGDAIGADAATGFLVAGPYDLVKSVDINLTLNQRQDELADIVNTTGTAFLGLTLGCARCHDHKFDPVSQRDFYALTAVFAGVQHAERPLPGPTPSSQIARLQTQMRNHRQKLATLLVDLRRPVNARHNIEHFHPVRARFVRFTIRNTNSSEPCLDELEIFTEASKDQPARNVALASVGTRATSSGNFPNHPLHQLAHINDGRYGNSFSWISNQSGRGWVQLELPRTEIIDRIEWARDREGRFADRLPLRYWIEVAEQPGQWKEVAGIHDRAPFGSQNRAPVDQLVRDDLRTQAALARGLQRQNAEASEKIVALTKGPRAYIGSFRQPGPTHRLYRGDPFSKREEVAPGGLSVFGPSAMAFNEPEQQRRVGLAKWLSTSNNPLVPRVIVNRLWHYHFGNGLVATPGDFGANGARPSHPQLLDWLAGRLVEEQWSLKSIHRLILTSHAWCQASVPRLAALKKDSDARLLWRFPPRRLVAESIRDSMLAASGTLDPQMGGPGFKVFEVVMENVRHYFPRKTFGPAQWRRMVYMTKFRQEQDEVFGAFDCPDGNQVVSRRTRSTTPLQAMNLLNGRFVLQQSDQLATRVTREAGPRPANGVRRMFRLTLGRGPVPDEARAAEALVRAHGLASLARALFNSSEFLWLP